MKLIIVLSLIAFCYAAKLDRTYLPPNGAATAGGSPGSLTAPVAGPSGSSGSGFSRPGSAQPNLGQPAPQYGAPSSFGQSRPGAQGAGQPSSQYGAPVGQRRPAPSVQFGAAAAPSFGQGPSGQPSNQYGGPSSFSQGGPSAQSTQPASQYAAPSGFGSGAQPGFGGQNQDYSRQQPERPQAAFEKNAEILRYENENDGERFSYSFETSNGISAEESGVAANGVQAQGGFAYTGDDGQQYRVTYTADENGYQPQGDHLPTSPPIPDEILRSIEENARAAAAGTQEGAYNPDEDVSATQQYNQPAFGQQGSAAYNQRGQASGPSSTYGAPSTGFPGSSSPSNAGTGFKQSSGQFSQGPSQFPSSDQGPQAQGGDSGYDYNRPQSSFPGSGSQGRPGQAQSAPQQYNRPGAQGPTGFPASGPSAFGSQTQQSFSRPSGQGPSSGPQSFGPTVRSQPSFGPSGPAAAQSSLSPVGQKPGQGRPSMPLQSAPYQYNRPGSPSSPQGPQAGRFNQPGSAGPAKPAPFQPTQYQGSQGQPQRPGAGQSRPGQEFGGPRQPPSFNEQEGYKY